MKKLLKKFHQSRIRTWIVLGIFTVVAPLAIILQITGVFGALSGGGGSSATPVAEWHFDEGVDDTCSGGTNDACDSSGSGNDAAINNDVAWQTEDKCVSGKCLYFDGSGDYLDQSSFNGIDAISEVTVCAWVKLNTLGTTSNSDDSGVFTQNGGAILLWYNVDASGGGEHTYTFNVGSIFTASNHINGTNNVAVANTWQHVCGVMDGENRALYIDGELNASSSGADNTTVDLDGFGARIGGWDNTSNFDLDGFLDEVKVFDSALTADQVKAEYAGGAAVLGAQDTSFLTQGLVGYWPMDDGSTDEDQTEADVSGNTHTATLFGDDGSGDNGSGLDCSVGGKFGFGCDLDGTDDYLSAAGSSDFQFGSSDDFTLSAWVKNNPDSTNSMIMAHDSSGGGRDFYQFRWDSDDELEVVFGDASGTIQSVVSANTFSGDEWRHVVMVMSNSTSTVYLYVNAVEEAADPITASAWDSSTSPTSLLFGRYNGASATWLDGIIDEARIYNRALSPAEVKALYEWAPGPVGYWNFDEGSGTTAFDRSGSENDGTLTNSPTYTTGKYGKALNFAGSNQQVTRADDADFDFNASVAFTLTAWFKHDTASATETILSKLESSGTDGGYKLKMESDGDITCETDDDDADTTIDDTATTTAATYDDNAWHHVACVYDTTNTDLIIYIDGVNTASDTSTTTNSLANDDALFIGIEAATGSEDWVGDLDEVKIYNYARTPQQIVEDMNAGHPTGGSPVGTEAVYWPLDEMTGSTAHDAATATSSDGTITNATWTPQDSCKFNGCLSFDAAGEVVTVATASDAEVDFSGSEPFSGSAWVYVDTMPGSGEQDAIIAKWDETNDLEGYRLVVENDDGDSTGNFEVEIWDDSANQAITATTSNDSVSQNTWYHVAFTFNGGTSGTAEDLILYVDGVYKDGNAANGSFAGLEDVASDFTVGEYDTNDAVSTNTAFTGLIDEVKMYPGELTASQVLVDMNGGASTDFGSTTNERVQDAGAGAPPVEYWDFNEKATDEDDTVADKSGNGNDGTLNGDDGSGDNGSGMDCNVPGKYGSACEFDGVDDFIVTTDLVNIEQQAEVSGAAWVKFDSLTGDEIIFMDADSFSGNSRLLLFRDESGSGTGRKDIIKINFKSGVYVEGAENSMNDTNWHHVAFTFKGNDSEGLRLYIDGKEDPNSPVSTVGTSDTGVNSESFRISNDSREMDGRIDEVKLWDYELTPAQVAYEYNRGAAAFYYKFDECTGTTAYNSALDSNGDAAGTNGTITEPGSGDNSGGAGDCSSGNGDEMWDNGTTGKFNASLDFDGTDDFVDLGTGSELDFGDRDFAYSAWVKTSDAGTNSRILSQDDNGNNVRSLHTSSNVPQFLCRDSASDEMRAVATTAINDDEWHYIVGVRSGDTAYIYVDGALENSDTNSDVGDCDGGTNTYIGARAAGGGGLFFNGQIDDVRIYNYALSAAQIKKIMNGGGAVRFGPDTGSP